MKKLINVSAKEFYDFLKLNNLQKVQGNYFHSNNYINNEGRILAYKETSSWGAETIYKILVEENIIGLNLVTNIMNKYD